jgi:hypothetical protein
MLLASFHQRAHALGAQHFPYHAPVLENAYSLQVWTECPAGSFL